MAYTLTQLLTISARRFPDRQALRLNGAAMTYEELERGSNRIARALQGAGVQPGDRVGIYVHKSFASVLSVFGIMKAGGVYVPLDPKSPANRLAYILSNCGVQVLLSATSKMAGLKAIFSEEVPVHTVLLLDAEKPLEPPLPGRVRLVTWPQIAALDAGPPLDPGLVETDLAYILYTSGSTGEPKGVMIAHRTILTFIDWAVEAFAMTEQDRVTSHAPLHFDLSTFDIYATIKAGGTVVLVPETLSIFPYRLAKFLAEESVTITYMVPSIFSLMLNYGKLEEHDYASLRTVLFAGEVFPIKYLRRLVSLIPHPKYYNLYGPTETNVCTYYQVMPQDLDPEETRPVPIGVACENTAVFARDEHGSLVDAPGVEGELWVRGPCVAQGYWADPVKTGERFLQHPFNPHYGEMVYRTGDIVMLDEDGVNWRFVGRRDHMVKSRGYRIELGEIEAAMYTNPAVKEAAVVAVPDPVISNRLSAFTVLQDGAALSAAELKAHCARHVPAYMVPETIEFLEGLPKTSTGKINRPALQMRAQDNSVQES